MTILPYEYASVPERQRMREELRAMREQEAQAQEERRPAAPAADAPVPAEPPGDDAPPNPTDDWIHRQGTIEPDLKSGCRFCGHRLDVHHYPRGLGMALPDDGYDCAAPGCICRLDSLNVLDHKPIRERYDVTRFDPVRPVPAETTPEDER